MPLDTTREGFPFYSAVWVWDDSAGAYINNTVESQTPEGTAFTIFDDTADFLYLGSESRTDLVAFLLATNGSVGAITYQYYNGSAWVRYIPRINYDFTRSGAEEWHVRQLAGWTTLAFSGTVPHTATPPDTNERYWIRISVASVSTSPTVNRIWARPYAIYCTATDVANLLQLDSDFSSTTTPTRNSVEDYINAAQAMIDYQSHKSWRPNLKTEEHYHFNIYGIPLLERDIINVFRVETWNGAEFDVLTEGRNNDWFFVPDVGLVYFSRYFLLPARLQGYTGPNWRWGLGEFNFAVRVSYLYGRDKFSDPQQGSLVWDMTKKMAAIDVFNNHDYGFLTVSGSDKVQMDRKIENWKQELEEKLDSLRSIIVI